MTISAPASIYSPGSVRAGCRSLAKDIGSRGSGASEVPGSNENDVVRQKQIDEAVKLYRISAEAPEFENQQRLSEFRFPFQASIGPLDAKSFEKADGR